ncbi:MAG: transposase [Candidatus Tisiphia sp.]|nr:transposase [Candidatus Tisiphia sp.]
MHKTLDIYTDYLICQNSYATATGLSDLLCGEMGHDKFTRFLNGTALGSEDLWAYIRPEVRKNEKKSGGVLILDDSIEEKPYSDENEIMCWHYSHAKGRHVKGVNILSCLVHYDTVTLPVGYEIVHKDIVFCDIESKKVKKKASLTKNEHFRNLIKQSHINKVLFDYVLADNWFGAKENLEYIHNLNKYFIIGIKSNRTISLSKNDKMKSQFQQVSSLNLKDGQFIRVWLKGLEFPVTLIKKVFINEDNSTGILYLVSNDLDHDADHLYEIYQKRWRIEVFHKSIKQNASLAKSPTKKVISQSNHIFASIVAFCKLEMLQLKTHLTHTPHKR